MDIASDFSSGHCLVRHILEQDDNNLKLDSFFNNLLKF